MADNTVLNLGGGGDTTRSVDKAGVKTTVVTLDLGGAGAESLVAGTVPVSGTVITGGLTDAQLRAAPVPVSNATLPLPTGASTAANQATEIASLASIDSKLANPLPVTGPLTDAQLRATPVPVSGTVAVNNFPATQPVSAASLPLPMGAALETGGNLAALLAELLLKARLTDTQPVVLPAFPAGQALMSASLPVTLASDQSTYESRIDRRAQEDGLLESMDLGSFALATRSRYERVSLTDRRGRTIRGSTR